MGVRESDGRKGGELMGGASDGGEGGVVAAVDRDRLDCAGDGDATTRRWEWMERSAVVWPLGAVGRRGWEGWFSVVRSEDTVAVV